MAGLSSAVPMPWPASWELSACSHRCHQAARLALRRRCRWGHSPGLALVPTSSGSLHGYSLALLMACALECAASPPPLPVSRCTWHAPTRCWRSPGRPGKAPSTIHCSHVAAAATCISVLVQDMLARTQELESRLLALNAERNELEAEAARMPAHTTGRTLQVGGVGLGVACARVCVCVWA